MNAPFFIAKRYLLSKKSHNLINIITAITMLGIGVASFALIVILSAFNGLEDVISGMNAKLAPDLLIEPKQGKTITLAEFPIDDIKEIDGIEFALPSLKEDALFRVGDKQHLGKVRGVSNEISSVEKITGTINSGSFDTDEAAVVGAGVAWHLDINTNDPLATVKIYVPQQSHLIQHGKRLQIRSIAREWHLLHRPRD